MPVDVALLVSTSIDASQGKISHVLDVIKKFSEDGDVNFGLYFYGDNKFDEGLSFSIAGDATTHFFRNSLATTTFNTSGSTDLFPAIYDLVEKFKTTRSAQQIVVIISDKEASDLNQVKEYLPKEPVAAALKFIAFSVGGDLNMDQLTDRRVEVPQWSSIPEWDVNNDSDSSALDQLGTEICNAIGKGFASYVLLLNFMKEKSQ